VERQDDVVFLTQASQRLKKNAPERRESVQRFLYPLLTPFEVWLAQHRPAVVPQEAAGG